MDKYMKNKYFKVILLTLGLIFATSSMSRAPYPYNSGRPNSNSVSYEDVYLHKVTSRYTSDTTFEIYIRADENMNFITSARPVIYSALMKNGNEYVDATITLHDDDGTGTDEIKIVVSGLDFSSRIFFSWTDMEAMGKTLFENYNYSRGKSFPIKFLRTFQFNTGGDYLALTADTNNTGWDNLDVAIDAEEEGMRWDKHRAVVFTSEVVTSTASALVRDTVDTDILTAQKWANLEDLKSKIILHKKEINKLTYPGMTNAHQSVITLETRLNTEHEAMVAKTQAKLVAFWDDQEIKTSEIYSAAYEVKQQMLKDDSKIELLESTLAPYLLQTNLLNTLKYTDEQRQIVIGHQDNYNAYRQALVQAKVKRAKKVEEQKRWQEELILEAIWVVQVNRVDNRIFNAQNALTAATNEMAKPDTLVSKNTYIGASEQANINVSDALAKLDTVTRPTTVSQSVVDGYQDTYSQLLQDTTALRANYAAQLAEVKRKRLEDEVWDNQEREVESVLTIANNALTQAGIAMSSNADLSAKLTKINNSTAGNSSLLAEIKKLQALKRTDADSVIADGFSQQHQTLLSSTAILMSSYVKEKRIVDEAVAVEEAALTGHWKFPIIKGLAYATATYSGVTDESGAFKCQLGEIVDFSIESLALTSMPCTEILGIKSTNSVAIANTSGGNFKDWQNEPDKQIVITKVLFGLFGESIKNAFNQEDESLKIVTVDLTDEQRANTVGESLEVNDLSLLVQSILGTTEAAVLPTTEQADNMIVSGWQASKVFDTGNTINTVNGGNTVNTVNDGNNDTGISKKSSGGGCVYNPNAEGRADIGFILLMVLSVYYLIRRKRLATI
jgi:hypothetical protein